MALFLEYRQNGSIVDRGKFSDGFAVVDDLTITLKQAVELAVASGNGDRNLRDWTLRVESDR